MLTSRRTVLLAVVSALSGAVWGAIAWSLLDRPPLRHAALALAASPLIGVIVGALARCFRCPDFKGRVALSLVGLYAAATLFGVALGLSYWVAGPVGGRTQILETTVMVVWGLTVTGYVLWLWPLSYLNHRLVWWLEGLLDATRDRKGRPTARMLDGL